MSSIIARKEILEILKRVKPGIASSKEVIQNSGRFIFRDNQVYTYNDYVTVSCPVDVDWIGAVPTKELYTLLSKLTDNEIECSVVDSHLEIRGSSFSASISLEKNFESLIESVPKVEKWTSLPKNFIDSVATCLHSVSKDITESILTCVHFNFGQVESCDNFRMTVYSFDDMKLDGKFLLPAATCFELIKFSPVTYSLTDDWLQFKMKDGCVFSCRLAQGDFPDLSTHIRSGNYYSVSFPKEISKVLSRAEIMADRDLAGDLDLKIKISKNIVEIKGEGQFGWYKESVKIDTSDILEMEFIINSEFLKYILKHFQIVEVATDKSKLRFSSAKFIHVIALTG